MSPASTLAVLVLLATGVCAQKHWSFRPVHATAPASGSVRDLAKTLDAFVAKRRAAAGLSAGRPADRRTLVRRLFLDVLGLPPEPSVVEGLVRARGADRWEKLVERVLGSPRYGERWAQHWLDIVRYADTHGFEVNTPRPNAWPYRDWVIRSLNADKPYDQFVREQLVGDALGADAATGFLVAGPAVLAGQVGKDLASQKQARQDQLDEIIKSTGTTFLGLTIGCARCHDHKFDPIRQKDYYAMQAVFAGVRYAERPLPNEDHARELATLLPKIAALRTSLREFEPIVAPGRSVILDDESLGVTILAKRTGFGTNPKGRRRGCRDDIGTPGRLPNISGGRYSWWRELQGRDLIAYRPGVKGRFRVWLSWGCGWETHTRAARYELDRDGDPGTHGDRRLLAVVDQRGFGSRRDEVSGQLPSQPLWSGLSDAGVHDLDASSAIVLRGGPGAATTADVVVLQEVIDEARGSRLPRLRRPVDPLRNIDRFAPTKARFVRFTSLATNSGLEPCLDELEIYSPADPSRNLALPSAGAKVTSSGNYPGNARHKLEHIHDGKYGNERSWISNEHGRGWVQIELSEPIEIDRIVWGRDRSGRYGDRLPYRYEIAIAAELGEWRVVASSVDRIPFGGPIGRGKAHELAFRFAGLPVARVAKARELLKKLGALEAQRTILGKGARVFAGTFVEPPPTHRLHRGDAMSRRERVGPDAPEAIGALGLALDAKEQDRRRALAQWIASADNPLTARVIVNRIWQHHFGTGLVDTPSDFGKSGSKPTHPELLDWLAKVLVEGEWSLKHVHRVILLSDTYRMTSAPNESALRLDAGNRLLWRFAPRRLEAEAIRDSILAVSGTLDLRVGGPGFGLFVPNTNYVRNYEPKTTWTKDSWRRMIYAHKVRMEPGGVFGAFDCPDAGQAAPKRGRSTTALQALNLFNSSFVLQQAGRLAGRVQRERSGVDTRVKRVFELTVGRAPTAIENRECSALVEKHGLAALCRVMLNTNEFLVLP
jgi:Protein of unknown function (DUF1553)/Protein of unknown function (DUF1549)